MQEVVGSIPIGSTTQSTVYVAGAALFRSVADPLVRDQPLHRVITNFFDVIRDRMGDPGDRVKEG